MNERTLELVAERFRILGDPLRLRLLHAIGTGELSVNELVTLTGTSQANVSKHLALLLRSGLVRRRKDGLRVFYAAADPSVFELCGLVCGSIQNRLEKELQDFDGLAAPLPASSPATGERADETAGARTRERMGAESGFGTESTDGSARRPAARRPSSRKPAKKRS
jgi:DNA-binding transcriptional ArsR family regulator